MNTLIEEMLAVNPSDTLKRMSEDSKKYTGAVIPRTSVGVHNLTPKELEAELYLHCPESGVYNHIQFLIDEIDCIEDEASKKGYDEGFSDGFAEGQEQDNCVEQEYRSKIKELSRELNVTKDRYEEFIEELKRIHKEEVNKVRRAAYEEGMREGYRKGSMRIKKQTRLLILHSVDERLEVYKDD